MVGLGGINFAMKTLLLFLCIPFLSMAQIEPVDVAELTIKVGLAQYEDLYYGFAEGDQIVFSLETMDGKPLKEVEIAEYPDNSKFMDYKPILIKDQIVKVNKTAVYRFTLHNTPMGGRVCKIKIQRIPKSEDLISFNTNWEWKTVYDTTYVPYTQDSIVGYDTTYIPYTVKELVKTDTNYIDQSKNERIHTRLNPDGDKSVISFDLPPNVNTEYRTQQVVAWAYWFGTGDPPKISSQLASASSLVYKISPVAALALGVLSLTQTSAGNNLNYFILSDKEAADIFYYGTGTFSIYDSGDGSSASSRNTTRLQGRIYFGFDNDHAYPVDVDVRFSVVQITKTYQDIQYQKEKITARKVTLNKQRMVVATDKIRVNAG